MPCYLSPLWWRFSLCPQFQRRPLNSFADCTCSFLTDCVWHSVRAFVCVVSLFVYHLNSKTVMEHWNCNLHLIKQHHQINYYHYPLLVLRSVSETLDECVPNLMAASKSCPYNQNQKCQTSCWAKDKVRGNEQTQTDRPCGCEVKWLYNILIQSIQYMLEYFTELETCWMLQEKSQHHRSHWVPHSGTQTSKYHGSPFKQCLNMSFFYMKPNALYYYRLK